MKYRKKPVVIDAFKVDELLDSAANNWAALLDCITNAYEQGTVFFLSDKIKIWTLEGTMTALSEDYIIRGVNGELYPCKPHIFEKTYEACCRDCGETVEQHKWGCPRAYDHMHMEDEE